MKTSDLQGVALDWAVAIAEGKAILWIVPFRVASIKYGVSVPYCPSTDWSLAGPIIEREHLSLSQKHDGFWVACIQYNYDDEPRHIQLSVKPLVAAMRCYVTSKLGDEVELPEELL